MDATYRHKTSCEVRGDIVLEVARYEQHLFELIVEGELKTHDICFIQTCRMIPT